VLAEAADDKNLKIPTSVGSKFFSIALVKDY